MRRVLLIAVVAAAVLPGVARAQQAAITQRVFDLDGNPQLVANPTPDGTKGTVSWAICRPAAPSCDAAGSESVLEPGPQPAGTVFEASVDYGAQRTTDRSPAWGGRVTATTRPALAGHARVGRRVRARKARWTGGWGDESDLLLVQACRTKTARHCVILAPRAIPRRYRGWYVFAVDRRLPAQAAFTTAQPGLRPAATVVFSAPRRVRRAA